MSTRPSPWPILTTGAARRAAAEVNPERQTGRRIKPNLRVLEGGNEPRKARLSPRARLVALVVSVGLVLFATVAFHVVLSQAEFKLTNISTKADAQQDQYQRLRLQVSQLESPARITSEAQSLGMVEPGKVTPVAPNADDMPQNSSGISSDTTSTSSGLTSSATSGDPGDWSQVKSQLNASAQ